MKTFVFVFCAAMAGFARAAETAPAPATPPNNAPPPAPAATVKTPPELATALNRIGGLAGMQQFQELLTATLPPGQWEKLPPAEQAQRRQAAEQMGRAPEAQKRGMIVSALLQTPPTVTLGPAGDRTTLLWQKGILREISTTSTVTLPDGTVRRGSSASGAGGQALPPGIIIGAGPGPTTLASKITEALPLELSFVKVNGQWYLIDATPLAKFFVTSP